MVCFPSPILFFHLCRAGSVTAPFLFRLTSSFRCCFFLLLPWARHDGHRPCLFSFLPANRHYPAPAPPTSSTQAIRSTSALSTPFLPRLRQRLRPRSRSSGCAPSRARSTPFTLARYGTATVSAPPSPPLAPRPTPTRRSRPPSFFPPFYSRPVPLQRHRHPAPVLFSTEGFPVFLGKVSLFLFFLFLVTRSFFFFNLKRPPR